MSSERENPWVTPRIMLATSVRVRPCNSRVFFLQAEGGIRDADVTGVQTCALPIYFGLRRQLHLAGQDPLRGLTEAQVLSGQVKLPPQTKVILDPNFKSPFTWQYSVGFQKQVNSVTSFDSDLIGWRWSHDQRDYDVNLFFDSATGYQKDPAKAGRPNPTYGPVWLTVSSGKRDYLALANSVTRRLKNNFQAGAAHTLLFYIPDHKPGGSRAL